MIISINTWIPRTEGSKHANLKKYYMTYSITLELHTDTVYLFYHTFQ